MKILFDILAGDLATFLDAWLSDHRPYPGKVTISTFQIYTYGYCMPWVLVLVKFGLFRPELAPLAGRYTSLWTSQPFHGYRYHPASQ